MDDYNDSAEFDEPLEQRHRYFVQSTFTKTFGASTPNSNLFRRCAVRKLRKKPPFLACSIEEAQQMFPNSHKSSAFSFSFDPEETQRLRPLPASRRMRSNFTLLAFTIILSAVALCRATQEQGFFSGQSLLRLESTINLHSRTTLSFMTCTPQGELLYQKRSVDAATSKKADVFKVEIVPPEQPSQTKIMPVSMMSSKLMMSPSTFATSSAAIGVVRLTWKVAGRATAQHIISNINVADGRGHLVDIHYKLGSLIFGVDTTQIIIANSTNNAELFDINLGPPNDGLVVGRGFTGCIQGGVSLSFEPQKRLEDNGVAWDRCSSSTMSFGCAAPLVDHCLSQPCRVGSLCRPQPTTNVAGARQLPYYCQCAARYTGQNCEIDQGPLCLKPENQCLNGGFCVEINFGNGTRCRCPPGFLGARCEESVKDFCKLHSAENAEPLCRNGGTCVQNAFNDGYTCKCAPGWTGAACEIEINECAAQQPCMHNGRCTDAVNGYQCDCTGTGYEGRNCEVNIDECAAHQQPCGAQGTCFDTLGNYTCSCPPGYEGQRCELDVDECVQLQQPCRNGGTCRDAVNNYECLCPTGFAGRTCEINVDDCAGIVCPDPGMVCVDGVNNSTCECPKGTVRQQESTKNDAAVVVTKCRSISECIEKNIKCENGGKCVDIGAGGGHRCECSPGFTGPTCATTLFPSAAAATVADSRSALLDDVQLPQNNVCISGINGKPACKNNGTCLRDGTDKFQCVCRDGTTGQRCEINHNECEQNPCMNNATCEDLLGDFKCHCLPGWSGRWCHKVFDACEQAPCMNNGRCISSAPSSGPEYQCECPPGFTGKRCETQIDNCLGVACGDARHVCYNLANNYKCDCAPGWTGPDCAVRRNECERKPCRNGATCTENLNSSALANVISSASSNIGYTCTCPAGYTGRHCERDIDECLLPVSPCRNGAKCDNTPGSYRCFCVPGFIGNDCGQEVNLCLTRPCENGATCISRINGYECQCVKGFQGPTCALDVDECAALPTPCENGATCVNSFGGYNCTCAPGFEGQRCEINIDECAPRPCQHGGVCIDGIASFQCQCNGTGFTGTVCDEKINECVKREQPCQNGGTCVDAVNDYSCNCLPALEGKNCTIDIPDCDLPPRGNPCQNGGTCLEHSKPDVFALLFPNETFSWNLAAGFTCVCPTGFTGQNCEINIDDCVRAQTPCQHGSTCIDLINEFECACKPGYEGYYCEQQIDMCRRYRSCRNGAICMNRVDGNNSVDYECQCPQGFAGRNCSIALTGCAVSSSSQELCEHGTCEPYLDYNAKSDVAQAYRCRCEAGYSGEICGKSSVLSFSGEQSFVKIEDVRLSRVAPSKLISFEFRTSVLSDGILAVLVLERRDVSPLNVQLALHNGSLQLSLKIENQQQDVTQELPLAKFTVSDWTYVQVELLPERIQMIVSQNSSTNFTIKEQIVVADAGLSSNPTLSISRIWLGSAPLRFEQFIASNTPPHRASFIGCMRDVNVTAFTVALADIARQQHQKSSGSSSFGSAASNVRDLCVVQPRCATGDECGSRATPQRGTCVDMWTTHKCQCHRPYYGSECEFEYPAVTFGHDNRASKVVIAIPTAESRRGDSRNSSAALSSQLEYHSDVSFMFRTTETSALLFYLGSFDRSSYVELHLINSTTLWLALTLANFDKLYVEPTWTASTGGVKLNDGELHTIRVVRDRNILRVLVDGDRLVIADTIPGIALHAQVLYVGNYAAAADNDGQMMAMASDNTFTISGKSVVDGGHHVAVRRFKRQSLSGQSLPLLSGQRASFSSNLFPTSSTTREPFVGETSNSPITPDAYFNTEDVTPSWSANGAASTTDSSLTTASSLLDLSTILPSIGVASLNPTLNGRSSLGMLYNDGAVLAGRSGAATAIPPVADENFFKGVVQDFRLNDRLVLFAEPPNELLRSSTKAMPSSLALLRAQQPVENILPGVVSDDICKIRSADGALCLNGGECKTIPWNDYNCTCQSGFWGERCELLDYCTTAVNTDLKVRGASETVCGIRQATCRNLVDGFECSTTATFNGRDSQIVYEAQFQQRAVAEVAIHNVSLELRTREPRVEALVRFRLLDYYLDVGIDGGRIVVDYMLGNTGTRLVSEDVRVDDGAWHTVTVVVNDMSLQVYVNNTVLVGEARTIQKISLAALVMGASSNTAPTRNAVRNGLPSSSSPSSRPGLQIDLPVENIKREPAVSHPTIILGRNFLGCLRNARVGPYLLPFLSAALNSGSGSFDNPAPNKFALKSLVNVNIGACASSDACLTATDRCLHGKCIDTWNAYRCECDSGWAGKFCQHNLLGCDGGLRSYQQQPNEHYHYDQTAVVAVDRLPCKNNATCQNTADGHVKCWCLPGFSGERCETEIDECAAFPCQNGALCEDHIDDFRCVCLSDFTGKLCSILKSARCADQPCAASDRTLSCTHRNMTALRVAAETIAFALPRRQLPHFVCACADGTEGDTCDSDIRYCRSNPCKNAGVCYEKQQQILQQSLPATSTTRKSAQKTFPTATSSTTTNTPMEGVVNNYSIADSKYTCKCQTGWNGKHCELDIDECVVGLVGENSTTISPCDAHHGKCVNEPGSYRCECETGYTGARCQKPDCSLVQCHNGGQCRVVNGDGNSGGGPMWKCDCSQSRFYGPLCNIERPCLAPFSVVQTQCLNGGVCVDLEPTTSSAASNSNRTDFSPATNMKCECPYNYTGLRCETEVDFCLRNPCVNGNCTRIQQFPGYRCDCYAGWTGISDCKVDIDFCNPSNHHLLGNEERRRLLLDSKTIVPPLVRKSRMLLLGENNLPILSTTTTTSSNIERLNRTLSARRPGAQRTGTPASDAEIYEKAVALPALLHQLRLNQNFNVYKRNNSFTRPASPSTSSVKVGSVSILRRSKRTSIQNGALAEFDSSLADRTKASVKSKSPVYLGMANIARETLNGAPVELPPQALQRIAETDSILEGFTSPSPSLLANRRSLVTLIDEDDSTAVIDVVAFCGEHGTCRDANLTFVCACRSGFKGVHCEQDVNECVESEVSPCQNGGNCFNLIGSYRCDCLHPFSGLTCAERTGINKLSIIFGVSVGVALVIVVVGLITFCCMAKKKRATRGTYSPSRQEMFGSRVEMNHVMRKPPQERLI